MRGAMSFTLPGIGYASHDILVVSRSVFFGLRKIGDHDFHRGNHGDILTLTFGLSRLHRSSLYRVPLYYGENNVKIRGTTKHELMPYLSNFAGRLSLCFYAAERSRTLTLQIVIDASASFYIVEGTH